MRRLILALLLIAFALPAEGQTGRKPAFQRGYLQTELIQDSEGNVGMLWVKVTDQGHDIYYARRHSTGAFQDPVKVNSSAGDVKYLALDQARPGVAEGLGGAVGVSWFDTSGRLFVAISRDRGTTFGEAIEVDPTSVRPDQAFSDVVFDASGTLFVTWIDTRTAPAGMEEPAHLYMARIDDDRAPVIQNMTAEFTTSICGCCRPDINANGRDIAVAYRNAGEDGFRDIYRIQTGANLKPVEPERMGRELWKINACPMAGPLTAGDLTWFLDGSTGTRKLMEAHSSAVPAQVIDAVTIDSPEAPRLIIGRDGSAPMLYLRSNSGGQVILREGGQWRVILDEVPYFCRDMTWLDGELLLIGDKEGTLWMEAAVPQ